MNPRVVAFFMLFHIFAWLAVRAASTAHAISQPVIASAAVSLFFSVLAFGIAFVINLGVASEYQSSPWMFAGWICFAANCGISVVRSILESHALSWIWPGYVQAPLYQVLHQTPIAIANLFLLAGLVSMWIAIRSLGLQVRLSAGDWTAIGLIAALLFGLAVSRNNLEGLLSPYQIALAAEQTGLVILSLCAVISVVLRRWAVEMGGGHLARALQFLAAYVTLRSLLVFVTAYFTPGPATPGLTLAIGLGWSTVPWLATLAAVSCARLSVDAAHELEQRRALRTVLILD